ncbi:phosphodiester glycosidase family protein [Anaerosporobacter faecicola]|uniref:phosphodiester glycosidase family protein n=1 Tax=Anaerosporobacter faecicola TaxID=2718714 RepID=UPI001EE53EE9|nr:phosphodiester glycosidase family protein [Anaerosporobacter faecicola]
MKEPINEKQEAENEKLLPIDEKNESIKNTQKIQSGRKKKHKNGMPIPAMIVIDVALYLICMGSFLLYFYVLPHYSNNKGKVVASTDPTTEQFSLEVDNQESASSEESTTEKSTSDSTTDTGETTSKRGSKGEKPSGSGRSDRVSRNVSNDNTSEQEADTSAGESMKEVDKTVEEIQNYADDKAKITVNKVTTGSGSDTVTYYVADVQVSNITYLRTGFASGEYGKNIRESVQDMAEEYNAILAMSGDYYGNTDTSVVIRNGVLYREDITGTDICVLFTDGTMKTYSPDEFDADEVIAAGAWQAWNFGPSLLDEGGNISSSFNTTSYLNTENPRAAIGYIEPGHYVFVVVDGRDEGYSRGVTLSELAGIMSSLDCQVAYNLDGGKSSAMVYDGEYVNQPADGGRTISDIIYIGEE